MCPWRSNWPFDTAESSRASNRSKASRTPTCYPVGTVVENPHTRRIRKLVVQQGPQQLGGWVEHERDLRADYLAAFGRPPGPLTAVGVMTDANNLATQAEAWYGPLTLRERSLTTR